MSAAIDRINELQKMIVDGKEPTAEEMLTAIDQIRAERGLAAKASVEKKEAKVKAQAIDIMALFGPPAANNAVPPMQQTTAADVRAGSRGEDEARDTALGKVPSPPVQTKGDFQE